METEVIYDQSYFARYFKALKQWEPQAAHLLLDVAKATSVADFGCGAGFFIKEAIARGLRAKGFELYLSNVKRFIDPVTLRSIECVDITQPMSFQDKFDCVISIEVAEHLPNTSSKTFIKNITNSSSRLIIFSAAPPGQGGSGHINCQPKEFWIDLINDSGFIINRGLSKSAKIGLRGMKGGRYNPNHIINNLIIFEKKRT